MIGHEFSTSKGRPYTHRVVCRCCQKGCAGLGFCPGDAMAQLPCRTPERLAAAGARIPTFKEVMEREQAELILV